MYQKKIKQLTAAVLCAAMVMNQAPTAYAAVDSEEFLVIENSSETELSQDSVSFDETSNDTSEDIVVEDTDSSDDASIEASEVTEDSSSEDSSTDSDEISISYEASQDVAEDTKASELPEGIEGMPEDYVLTSEESELKQNLVANTEALEMFSALTEGVDYISDQVICVAETEEHAAQIAAAYSGELLSYEYGVAVIDLSGSAVDVATAYSLAFEKDLNLPAVEPNFIYHLIDEVAPQKDAGAFFSEDSDDESADFESANAWWDIDFNDEFLDPSSQYYQWHHDMIGTYDAWKISTGDLHNITVAVIDSGVQSNHPELSGRVKLGVGGNDGDGHGTHIAGIIAAAANNKVGGAGIAPNANIISCQVFDANGDLIADDAILKSIRYVAGIESSGTDTGKARADIINLSLGGPAYDEEVQQAINLCYTRGTTVIAAMGNELSNHKSYPAAYDHVIAVGAVTEKGTRAYFSCYGYWQDIAAPGTDISSSYPTSLNPERCTLKGYDVMDGTSQATPLVSGACALYMGYVGKVSPDEMLTALQNSSKDGILNIGNLLKTAAPEVQIMDSKVVTSVTIQNDPKYSADYKITEKKGSLSSITLYLSNSALNSIKLTSVQTSSSSAPAPQWTSSDNGVATVTVDSKGAATVKAMSAGKAIITCAATDGSGKKASVTIKVVQGVTNVLVSGQTVVAPGAKVSYKATVYPLDANNKKVTYQLDKEYSDIHINAKTGKVTVDKNAQTTSFKVKAISADPSYKDNTTPFSVTVKAAKATTTKVTVAKPADTTLSTGVKGDLTNTATLKATVTGSDADIIWQSSDESIAKISKTLTKNDEEITVTALKPGKVKITAKAADGSKKKASVSFKVINPVASIHLVAKGGNSDFCLATGCSTTFTPVIGATYGKPTSKKVTWTYEIKGRGEDGLKDLNKEAQDYIKKNNAFFTVKKGKVTANSLERYVKHMNALKDLGTDYPEYAVVVRATAADRSGTYDEKTLYIVPKNKSLSFISADTGYYQDTFRAKLPEDDIAAIGVFVNEYGPANYYQLAVESSDPDIANGNIISLDTDAGTLTFIRIVCTKKGKCKFKVKTVDGSNVSGTFTVIVE